MTVLMLFYTELTRPPNLPPNKGASPQTSSTSRFLKLITDVREASQESALKDTFDSKLLNRCVSFVHLFHLNDSAASPKTLNLPPLRPGRNCWQSNQFRSTPLLTNCFPICGWPCHISIINMKSAQPLKEIAGGRRRHICKDVNK